MKDEVLKLKVLEYVESKVKFYIEYQRYRSNDFNARAWKWGLPNKSNTFWAFNGIKLCSLNYPKFDSEMKTLYVWGVSKGDFYRILTCDLHEFIMIKEAVKEYNTERTR